MGEVNVAVIAPILGRELSFVSDVDTRVRVFDANFAAPGRRAGAAAPPAPGSDLAALAEKRIAVTPLRVDLTDTVALTRFAAALDRP